MSQLKSYAVNEFFRYQAEELALQLKMGRQFLTAHKPSLGFGGECVLRGFLQSHLPSTVQITSGFVVHGEEVSHQCDIIIYDKRFAPLAKFGEIEVVPSKAVLAVIEVKSSIRQKTFDKTLSDFEQLGSMGVANKFLFVFAPIKMATIRQYFWGKPSPEDEGSVVADNASRKYDNGREQSLPSAIVSLGENYFLSLDYVDTGQDTMGYSAYRYVYTTQKNKRHSTSCLQFFIGSLTDCCKTTPISYQEDVPPLMQEVDEDLGELESFVGFSLWNM